MGTMHRTAVAAVLLVIGVVGTAAAPVPCTDDPRIKVDGADNAEVARICTTAARARPQMSECHLTQSRPLLIRLVDELTHPNVSCMVQYDCRDDSISVTRPDALADILRPDSIWARIAPKALFDSLIVHELAHAFLDQTECAGIPCHADHEYIAYALQIDSLSPANRTRLLEGHRVRLPVDPMGLNDFTAAADPDYFAQGAWLHFSAPGNGCDFVRDLLEGRQSLRMVDE